MQLRELFILIIHLKAHVPCNAGPHHLEASHALYKTEKQKAAGPQRVTLLTRKSVSLIWIHPVHEKLANARHTLGALLITGESCALPSPVHLMRLDMQIINAYNLKYLIVFYH